MTKLNRIQTIPTGSKVMIKPCSEYYRDHDSSNPINVVGIVDIYDSHASLPYIVKWSDKHKNGYRAEDLEYVDAPKPEIINQYEIY